jgi:hypothetical protein
VSISNGYATLTEIKSALRITDTLDDSLLEMAIESASRLIDGYANRSFYSAGTATRYFVANDSFLTVIDDLVTLTSLETSSDGDGFDTTWTASDYQLEPLNGYVDGLQTPYTEIRAVGDFLFPIIGEEALVKIVGAWGYSSIPITIKQACILQASRIYKRLDSPLGVAGFGDLGVIRVSSRLDPDVAQLVDPYRKVYFA